MSKAVKYAERAVTIAAQGAWSVFERLNRISPNASFTPKHSRLNTNSRRSAEVVSLGLNVRLCWRLVKSSGSGSYLDPHFPRGPVSI